MSSLTWDVARAGGFSAYLLITASVLFGLVLSLGWRSALWPRFITADTHRFVTTLALSFTAVHGFAIWIDPFQRFGLSEVLVPLTSHYRPLWMAFGIVAGYLMLALYLSEYARPLIGYSWWRRLHFLTFAVFVISTVHGLGTGSDTKTWWATLIYGGSFVAAVALLAARLLAARQPSPRVRLGVAGVVVLLATWGCIWALAGPLQPGWNVIANTGQGSGARDPKVVAGLAASAIAVSPSASPTVPATMALPLSAQVEGTISYDQGQSHILIHLVLQRLGVNVGRAALSLVVSGGEADGFSVDPTTSTLDLSDLSGRVWCQGRLVGMSQGQLVATCQTGAGTPVNVVIALGGGAGDRVNGSISATAQ